MGVLMRISIFKMGIIGDTIIHQSKEQECNPGQQQIITNTVVLQSFIIFKKILYCPELITNKENRLSNSRLGVLFI